MREAASRGFWVASKVPYGFGKVYVHDGPKKRPTLEPDPATAPIVERIFEMSEAGKGMLDITRTLNDEGIASPAGKVWGKTSVHKVLTNEAYTGTLVWGANAKDGADPVRVEKAFPAIVSKTRFRRVNRQLRRRAPKVVNPRRVGSSFLLSGLVDLDSDVSRILERGGCLVLEAEGRRILVKGRTSKEMVLVETTPDKETYRERLKTTVVALGLDDGEIIDSVA